MIKCVDISGLQSCLIIGKLYPLIEVSYHDMYKVNGITYFKWRFQVISFKDYLKLL